MATDSEGSPDLEKGSPAKQTGSAPKNDEHEAQRFPDIVIDSHSSSGSSTFSPADYDFVDAFAIDFGKDSSLSIQEAQTPFRESSGEAWPAFCHRNLSGLRVILMNSLAISGESFIPQSLPRRRSSSFAKGGQSPKISGSPHALRRRPSSIRTTRSLSVKSGNSRSGPLQPQQSGQSSSLSPKLGSQGGETSPWGRGQLQANRSDDPTPNAPRSPHLKSPLAPPKISIQTHVDDENTLTHDFPRSPRTPASNSPLATPKLSVQTRQSRDNAWVRELPRSPITPMGNSPLDPPQIFEPGKREVQPHQDWDANLFLNVSEASSSAPNIWGLCNLWSPQPASEPFWISIPFPIPELFTSDQEPIEEPCQVPLKACFQNLLLSTTSATSLLHYDPSLSTKLVTLDLLRSALECWIRFLAQLTEDSSWTGVNRKTTDSNINIFSHDNNMLQLRAFSSAIDDLSQAIQYTTDSILLRLNTNSQSPATIHIRDIHLTTRAKLSTLHSLSSELVSREQRISETIRSLAARDEANSLRAVTILAAIFLPLTLASSLLSMQNRASSLGAIWYDFIGLALLLGVPLFITSALLSTAQRVGTKTGNQSIKTMLSLTATMLKIRFDRRKSESAIQAQLAQGKISPKEARRRSRRDVAQRLTEHSSRTINTTTTGTGAAARHALIKPLLSVLLHAFSLLLIASFLTGMFHPRGLPLGLRILAYGSAATAGLFLLAFLLWALVCVGIGNAVFWVVKGALVGGVMGVLVLSEYFGFRSAALPRARELASRVWRVEALGLLVLLGLGEEGVGKMWGKGGGGADDEEVVDGEEGD
ncbi:MAG: hypothetical protein Q9227_007894 [Pyrenula ochraceoflavens]